MWQNVGKFPLDPLWSQIKIDIILQFFLRGVHFVKYNVLWVSQLHTNVFKRKYTTLDIGAVCYCPLHPIFVR